MCVCVYVYARACARVYERARACCVMLHALCGGSERGDCDSSSSSIAACHPADRECRGYCLEGISKIVADCEGLGIDCRSHSVCLVLVLSGCLCLLAVSLFLAPPPTSSRRPLFPLSSPDPLPLSPSLPAPSTACLECSHIMLRCMLWDGKCVRS